MNNASFSHQLIQNTETFSDIDKAILVNLLYLQTTGSLMLEPEIDGSTIDWFKEHGFYDALLLEPEEEEKVSLGFTD
ncbi:TPA: hypothetical protein KDY05_002140 [Vibrio parahaemolyticus]|nr:hypothetical protein [Vibrio parahaemolyticus]